MSPSGTSLAAVFAHVGYMERALEIWRDLPLPALTPKEPWWGYSLGHWTQEEEQEAALAVKGCHHETGKKQHRNRRQFGQ
jgi:hypothetical protein